MSARKLVGAVAAAAMVGGSLLAAAPAFAATVNTLPSNVTVAPTGETVAVSVPAAAVCAGDGVVQVLRPGKKNNAVDWSAAVCTTGILTATGTPNPASTKKNSVVKFVATVNGEKVVQTLVVHIDKKPAKPGKPE